MSNDLSLSLQLVEQSVSCLRFRLTLQSRATAKLFLPFPEITGLTSSLISVAGSGFVLEPAASQLFEWRVRPCHIEHSGSREHPEYYRWCVDVSSGEYQVTYHFEITVDYFDPDSHMRLPDLERMANAEEATVWLGKAESNSVSVIRDIA